MGNLLIEHGRWDIREGVIHYRIYQQDGTPQEMTCADTSHNRQFVSWVQAYDRWPNGISGHG